MMAARYFTKVATEYLGEILANPLPAGLTLIRKVGQLAHEPGVTLVEIEDRDAPDTMTGHLVMLTLTRSIDPATDPDPINPGRVHVSSRTVVDE